MKRKIEKMLEEWKNDTERMPLIIRGARQVGKSYIIEKFGNSSFDSLAVVNFEYQKDLQTCFCSLNPKKNYFATGSYFRTNHYSGKNFIIFR